MSSRNLVATGLTRQFAPAAQATEAPIMNGLLTQLAAVGSCFWNMDKIDKTQFPFPYCQVVRLGFENNPLNPEPRTVMATLD